MSDMRELVLDRIDSMRLFENGFKVRSTMRWSGWYLHPNNGIVWPSKKERSNSVLLAKTTREHFDALSDAILLNALELIIRQFSKQM